MKLRVFATKEEGGLYGASLVERVVEGISHPVLGLATGATVTPLYAALARLHRSGLDLSQCTTINLDEYIGLPPDHPQSYHHFMDEHLFRHVNIPPTQVHIPDGMAADLTAECSRYDAIVTRQRIDFQLLGIGVNGHIGFNEPSHILQSNTHVVTLRQETLLHNAKFFEDYAEVPKLAITMGVQAILQAKQIVLMAFGAEKAPVIARAFFGDVRTDVPASILQLHQDVTLILDAQSARELP